MPAQTRPLRDVRRVTLDAAGAGEVSFGPGRPNTKWVIRRISVQTSTSTLVPEANMYRGNVGAGTFIGGTFVGSNDTDDALSEQLYPGEKLTVRWTGGDVGAIATATFSGDEITGVP